MGTNRGHGRAPHRSRVPRCVGRAREAHGGSQAEVRKPAPCAPLADSGFDRQLHLALGIPAAPGLGNPSCLCKPQLDVQASAQCESPLQALAAPASSSWLCKPQLHVHAPASCAIPVQQETADHNGGRLKLYNAMQKRHVF